ncbi:MAG TPA: hypothetical protein GXZ32_01425 [Clostridiales bacterium]|nr:hypothetical protein [Clostridiales bacterium]
MEERFLDNDQKLTAILATNIKNNTLFNDGTDTYHSTNRGFSKAQHNLLIATAIVFFIFVLLDNRKRLPMSKDKKESPLPLDKQPLDIPSHKNSKSETGRLILIKEKKELKDLLSSLRAHFNPREQNIIDLFIKVFELDDSIKTIKEYRHKGSKDTLKGFAYTRDQGVGVLKALQPYLVPKAKSMAQKTLKLMEVMDNFNNYTKRISAMEDDEVSFAEKVREMVRVFKPILSEKLIKNMDKMVKMIALMEMMNERELKNGIEKEQKDKDLKPDKTTHKNDDKTTLTNNTTTDDPPPVEQTDDPPSAGEKAEEGVKDKDKDEALTKQLEGDAVDDGTVQKDDGAAQHNDDTSQDNGQSSGQKNDIDQNKGGIDGQENTADQRSCSDKNKNTGDDNMLDGVRKLLNDESQREKLNKLMEIAKYMAKGGE